MFFHLNSLNNFHNFHHLPLVWLLLMGWPSPLISFCPKAHLLAHIFRFRALRAEDSEWIGKDRSSSLMSLQPTSGRLPVIGWCRTRSYWSMCGCGRDRTELSVAAYICRIVWTRIWCSLPTRRLFWRWVWARPPPAPAPAERWARALKPLGVRCVDAGIRGHRHRRAADEAGCCC